MPGDRETSGTGSRAARLTARLETPARLLVLRNAPGFGGKALLARWVAGRGEDTTLVWVSGTDGVLSWSRVHEAAADAGLVADLVASPAVARSAVRRALATARSRVVVVVEIPGPVQEHDVLEGIADLAARHVHLRLVALTTTAADAVESLLVMPGADVLGPSDLRYRGHEVGGLDPALAARLSAETDGWPAAVEAALVLLDRARPEEEELRDLLARLGTRLWDRHVAAVRPPQEVELLRTLAWADPLTPRSAGWFSGRTITAAALDGLGPLVHAQRPAGETFTLPRILRRAAWRSWPDGARERHRLLGADLVRRYVEEGDPAAALAQAAAIESWPLVERVLGDSWPDLLSRRPALVAGVLQTVPPGSVRARPWIAVAGRLARGERPTRPEVAGTVPGSPAAVAVQWGTLPPVEALGRTATGVLAYRAAGDTATAAQLAGALLQELPHAAAGGSVPPVPGIVAAHLGITLLRAGRWRDAVRALHSGDRPGSPGDPGDPGDPARGLVDALLALHAGLVGEHEDAARWHDSARRALAGPTGPSDTGLARDVVALSARLGRLDAGEPGPGAPGEAGSRDPASLSGLGVFAAWADAREELLDGDPIWGIGRLRRVRDQLGPGGPGPVDAVGELLLAAEVDLLLAAGRGNEAWAALQGPGSGPELELARARVAYLSGEHDEARTRVARLLAGADLWPRTRLEARLVQAALARTDGPRRGLDAELVRRLGGRSGLLRLLRPADLEDLAAVPGLHDRAGGASALVRGSVFPDAIAVIRLTERELVVLAELDAGVSVADIGVRLFVSRNTVKSQLRSLYAKLGVHTRDQAVTRARELGLVGG